MPFPNEWPRPVVVPVPSGCDSLYEIPSEVPLIQVCDSPSEDGWFSLEFGGFSLEPLDSLKLVFFSVILHLTEGLRSAGKHAGFAKGIRVSGWQLGRHQGQRPRASVLSLDSVPARE